MLEANPPEEASLTVTVSVTETIPESCVTGNAACLSVKMAETARLLRTNKSVNAARDSGGRCVTR